MVELKQQPSRCEVSPTITRSSLPSQVLVGEAPNQGDRNAGSPMTFATPVSITTSPKKEPDAQSWRAQKAPHPVQAKLNEPWRSQNTSRNQFNSGSSNHTASLFANSSVSDEQVHAPVDKGKLLVNSHDRRSILISGLPGYATLKDIAESVQGGIVLNMFMFLRKHEHVAHVTFVETVSAEAFVHYASNNEIKIRGKRVSRMSLQLFSTDMFTGRCRMGLQTISSRRQHGSQNLSRRRQT